MFATPVPRLGDVLAGRDAAGRALRISAHPGSDRVILSIWQDGKCVVTVRLAGEDLPRLQEVLSGLGEALEQPYPRAS